MKYFIVRDEFSIKIVDEERAPFQNEPGAARLTMYGPSDKDSEDIQKICDRLNGEEDAKPNG